MFKNFFTNLFKKDSQDKNESPSEPPEIIIEEPVLYYSPGLNNNEPILKKIKIEDGYFFGEFIEEDNIGKKHCQKLEHFYNCFSVYRG